MSFPSMVAGYNPVTGAFLTPSSSSLTERKTLFGVDLYLDSERIPEISWPSVTWKLNNPIGFSANIYDLNRDHYERTIPGRNNGVYTDNFVKITYTVEGGGSLYLPKLVIKNQQINDEFITIQGVDLVTEILNDEINHDPYICNEYLERIDETTWQSNLLTADWTDASLVFVNGISYSGSVSFNDNTRVLTITEELPKESSVLLVNPMSSNTIIEDLLTDFSEDFEFDNDLPDFLVYNNITFIERTPLDFLKEFLEATVGEYYIISNAGGTGLKLILQEKSYTAAASKYIPPELYKKGGPSYSRSDIKRFNTINVKRLALVPEIIQSAPDIIISDTITSDDPKEIDFDYTAEKDSIEFQKVHWVEDGGLSPQPLIDSYINEQTQSGTDVCSGIYITADLVSSHYDFEDTEVLTPDSAYTLQIQYKVFQSVSSIYADGLNVEVIDDDHETLYGTKLAKFDIVNGFIEDSTMAEAMGTEALRENAKNQDFSLTTAFFEDIKPSDFHRVTMEKVFSAERKIEEINITDVLKIKYEAVPGDVYEYPV